MLMGFPTYGMNDCHDTCYMRHEPLPFHMIWHNTWPIFHDTVGIHTCIHIGDRYMYAYMHINCMHTCIRVPYDTWHKKVENFQIHLL
jgi:hypothetical protein